MLEEVAALATKLGGDLLRAELLGVPRPVLADRYEVHRVLGRGASGVVVRAHDHRLMRTAAVKIALETSASSAMLVEARALAQLRRPPNVVQVYDVSVDDLIGSSFRARVVYVAMELVEGITLRTWLGVLGRSPAEVLEKFAGAAAGLAQVHALGIVHGDFKPDNIMVDASGTPLLVDFGFAGRVRPEVRGVVREVVVGTGPYLAPEVRKGKARRRSDLYAFAVSLWEALTGVMPFDGIAPRLGFFGGTYPLRGEAAIPRSLLKLLRSAMHPNPSRRPRLDVLARALHEELGQVRTTVRRRRTMLAAGALAVLSGIGALWAMPARRFLIQNAFRRAGGASDNLLHLGLRPEACPARCGGTNLTTVDLDVRARGNPVRASFGGRWFDAVRADWGGDALRAVFDGGAPCKLDLRVAFVSASEGGGSFVLTADDDLDTRCDGRVEILQEETP